MRSVWSLTKLVVRESIRKRLLILLGTTCTVIVLVPFLLPSMSQAGTLQIAQSWLLTCITFFGIVTVLFIAGTSLPGDLREGRLFLMFTKPVHRSTYLLSKFLGFALVFVLFIGVAGGTGYLMLLFMERGNNQENLHAQKKYASSNFQFKQKRTLDKSVFHGELSSEDDSEKLVIGASGTTTPIARWTFKKKPGDTYERPPKVLLDLGGREAGKMFSVKVRLFVTIPVRVEPEGEEDEPRIRWRRVQREIKTIQQNQLARFTVLPERYGNSRKLNSVFDEVNRFRVMLSLANPAGRVNFHRKSLQITGPAESFLLNYLKALFMIFLLLIYLSAFLMAVTPLLSGPVSISLALLFYLIGSMTSFFKDALSVTQSTIDARLQDVASRGHDHVPNPDIPTWSLQYSQFVVEQLLAVIPNFEQFNQQAQLMEGWFIPMSTLYNGIGVTLPSVLLFVLVGTVLFQIREITT